MDRFYIWPDWNAAWSSAAATRGPHAASPPLVMLTAKMKRILSYSFICSVKTAQAATISQGYYSCHMKTPQRQAEMFGFSYLYNSFRGTPRQVFRAFFHSLCAAVRMYLGWAKTPGTENQLSVTCGRLSGLLISFRLKVLSLTMQKPPSYILPFKAVEMCFSAGCAPTCKKSKKSYLPQIFSSRTNWEFGFCFAAVWTRNVTQLGKMRENKKLPIL